MCRFAVILLSASVASAQPPKPATHQIKLDGHTFTLPAGFTVERVAGPPLVDRPIVASFDDRGRLYVADSSGSNEKVTEQLKNPTHRIVRLEDTNGDGKFDKSTVFADKMMFPEGILWHRGVVYVAAPPHIWKLTDADDDGKAEKRDIWFDGKTLTGCANDLHGPYLGPDGWLYWAKGAFAKQEYTLPSGKKFTTRASHIFRARPDGTGIEPVMTGGMDNPVDVAFLPNGERFFTTTFFQHPAAGNRDGLIHAVYGGIYGKDHDVIYDPDHKWTAPTLMPVMTHMGPAAPAGLHCYESGAFGDEYRSNLFACQFNLRKVSRHVLKPHGSTYKTEDSDFLVSDNTDFHPTDVIEDADGSLLVVDTGGWYKLCCPSSQLVKADVLGAIYRVRKADTRYEYKWFPSDAALAKTSDRELQARYYTSIPQIVRERIGDLVAERGGFIGRPTFHPGRIGDPNPAVMIDIWMTCQKDGDTARATNRHYLGHANDSVTIAAIHAASLWRDREAVPQLIRLLSERKPHVRRAAAEALGRIGDDRAVEPLLKEVAFLTNDRALDHALTYALIALDNRQYLKNSLHHESSRARRAALAALDQLGEKLDPKVVLEAMKSPDPALKETAFWIVGRHPEWSEQLEIVVRDLLAKLKPKDSVEPIAKFARSVAVQKVLADTASDRSAPASARKGALLAMSLSGLKAAPPVWTRALADILKSEDSDVLKFALDAAHSLPPPKDKNSDYAAALERVVDMEINFVWQLKAMAAMPGGVKQVKPSHFQRLLQQLDRDLNSYFRGQAADVLSRGRLSPDQLLELIEHLPKISPLELDRVLAAFAQTKDEAVGLKLVAALNAPETRPALRADGVKERIKHFPPAVQKEAEKLYVALNADYEHQRAKLEEMSKSLPAGDIRRGQAVFNSTKTSCIACHTVGYVGGKQGPDLTRIGGIRTERDLLESILFPSASFVRSYESVIVSTKDGRSLSGIAKKDAPDEIILVLAADKEARIPREDVEDVRPGKVSIMPDGLDKQLSAQELADLVAFLKACK